MQAKTPIPAIKDHWLSVGLTQINGITKVTNMAPTNPVINNVNNNDNHNDTNTNHTSFCPDFGLRKNLKTLGTIQLKQKKHAEN